MTDKNDMKYKLFENCLVQPDETIAIGKLPSTNGYQKVKVSIDKLFDAISILNKFSFQDNIVTLQVKEDNIISIGKDNIGVLIAPIVTDTYQQVTKQ